ncbi:MAG TPA: SusC/RagA family TonB-linked outer membrane protein [Kofleriaceae bacterium]|nr:SusC/RagA family TonB-linked outer membrane protein [Kofleriaceae bacterium]
MRREALVRLALFATVCVWQTGIAWGQAPPEGKPAASAKKGKTRSVTGTVLDDSGAAVAGATVKVKGSDAAVTTGAEGNFALEAPRAEVTIEVTGPEHVAKDVTLSARQKTVKVSLTRSAPTERTVTGIVKESGTGKPIAGAVVTLKGTQTTATSDEDGLFVLAHVPVGSAELEVASPDHQAFAMAVAEGQATAKLELQPTGGAAPVPTAAPTPAPAGGNRSVRGRITDSSGDVVPGATVQVVGTETLAITDEKGEFELADVPPSDVLLEVTSTGYEPVRLTAGAATNNVAATLKFASSEEIVIIGRTPVLMKTNLANGASTVNDRDLNRVSAQTLDAALTGKVSGANMQSNSGAPGGGTQLRLRGISTINGQSSPLYVIDGVIVSNQATPSGANLVTGAAAGGSASNQDNPVNRIADINPNDIENVEILKGASAAALYGSKAANGVVIITTKRGKTGEGHTSVNVTQRIGVAQVSNTLGSRRFTSADEVEAAFPGQGLAADFNGENFDHEKELTRTPIAYETIASASGGTQNGTYAGSMLVRDEPGVLKGTFAQKQSGKLTVGYNFDDKLQLTVNTNVIHTFSDRGLTNNDNTGTSVYVALSSTPSFINLTRGADGTFPVNPMASSNPLQTVALFQNEEDVWRFIGSANASYKVWSNDVSAVNLNANFGADRFQQINDLFSPNELQFENNDGLPGTSVEATTQNLNYNIGTGASWTLNPASGVLKSALSTGFTYESVDLTSVYIQAQNLNGGLENVDSATVVNTLENHLRTEDQGLFLQEEVSVLDDHLTLLAGLLAERSSLNGDSDKFFLFPKAAATYKLPIAEDLFNPIRVRAAYGEAGNRPNYGQKFTPLSAINTIDGNPGLVVLGNAGDPTIEPERQREIEFGLDVAMEDQKVVLELTGYQRNISNLLLQRQLPTSTGFGTQFENSGKMRNRGIEAALQVIPLPSGLPVDWTTRANLTLNRSKITDLPGGPFNVATVGFGAGLGAFRIEEGKSATEIVNDFDGDGDLDVVGDGEPDFRVGWSNDIKVGDFGVFSLIDWQKGSEIVNLTRLLYDFGQVTDDYVGDGEARLERFNMGDMRPYIEDASFVKLREVSVYYDLPKSVASQMGPLNNMRFSVQGRNLLTFTDYSGLDPEVSNFGNQPIGRNYDVAPYPPSRSFWLSIDAGF